MTDLFQEMKEKNNTIQELQTNLKLKEIQANEDKDTLVLQNKDLEKQINDCKLENIEHSKNIEIKLNAELSAKDTLTNEKDIAIQDLKLKL
jgi:hypothetical protein